MTRVCLLFGLLALADGQLIYPDDIMMADSSHVSGSAPAGYPTLQAANGSLSVLVDQQFNRGRNLAPQFGAAAPTEVQFSLTTARVPLNPINPTASPQPLPETWADHVNNIISRGITKFALDLDKAIYQTRGTSVTNRRENVLFSPLSVSVALSLVLLGSAGKTFDDVVRLLGLQTGVDISQHSELVHQMFGQLLTTMNYRVEGSNMPRVNSASGIFVQEGYPIRSQFRTISENAYQSEVINLDFRTKGREARDTINAWVKERTMEKIDSILNETPNPMTAVILLSALYFKGEWNQHFLTGMTRRTQFFVEPNDAIEIDMMYNGGNFPFYEDKSLNVKILALPYKGLETSMYVLLPKAEGATALRNFQDQLTPETIEHLIKNMKNDTCVVGFPRMKLSSELSLNSALHSLGLHSLFDPKTADLSLLSTGYGQTPMSQTVAAPIPQALPQIPRQIPSVPPNTKVANKDFLIFTRVDNNEDAVDGARRNYFTYDDRRRGVTVEQWNTGFNIRKIGRTRRDARNERRERNDTKSSRATYVTENDDLEKAAPKIGDTNTRYVGLDENKYRFRNADRNTKSRARRQSRPIDQDFLKFMGTQSFPSYGLDKLRNSAGLVNPGLYADEVLHKVEMEVTEKGTEAAATTGVVLRRDGNQKRLIANRPFIFFIRHDPTKLILFWGTVNAPTPNYAVVR